MKKTSILIVLAMASFFLLTTCKKDEEKKVELPTISTLAVTEITAASAKSGGNITKDGGGEITSKGIVWGTSQNPSFEQHTGINVEGAGAGLFQSMLTGLSQNTTYFIRAYATNSTGTSYGIQVQFQTEMAGTAPEAAFCGSPTSGTTPLIVNFIDQSTHNPTRWQWEFGDGNTSTEQNPTHTYDNAGNYSVTLTAINDYGSDTTIKVNFINVEAGTFILSPPTNVYAGDWHYQGFGIYWTDNSDNETGFRIYKAANSLTNLQEYATVPANTTFFADSQNNPDNYYTYKVAAYNANGESEMSNLAIVPKRPVNPAGQVLLSSVVISWAYPLNNPVESISIERSTTPNTGFTSIGYAWFTETHYEDNDVVFGNNYYYRLKSMWSLSGIDHSCVSLPTAVIGPFTLPAPCPPNLTDIDGNIYNTVLIGGQCWMKENLKTTKYRNGTPIEHPGADNSAWQNNTIGAYAWYNNDINWKESYGALYNWHAVNNSNGLCPEGWHVPSDTEWTELVDYVVGQGYPNQSYDPNGAGNALKSCRQENSPLGGDCNTTEHPRWNSNDIHHGFDAIGFSALPCGYRSTTIGFTGVGHYGPIWSSSDYSSSAWFRSLLSHDSYLTRNHFLKTDGYSVRCLRD